jgi:hypothetical protein
MVSHVAIGFIAAWIPMIGLLGLLYQLGQYALDIRTFPFEMTYKEGNSIQHTGLKLTEMLGGYILGKAFQRLQ